MLAYNGGTALEKMGGQAAAGLGDTRPANSPQGFPAIAGQAACSLDAILAEVRALPAHRLERQGAVLADTGVTPEAAAVVMGNADAVQQILLNLVTNALDAIKEIANASGSIALAAHITCHTGRLTGAVSDNGGGIPEDMADRIFEPFVTLRPAGKGVGPGSPICRTLAHSMGGDIIAQPVQSGTRMTLMSALGFPSSSTGMMASSRAAAGDEARMVGATGLSSAGDSEESRGARHVL